MVVVIWSVNPSPPAARSAARCPKNMVVAAARTTPLRLGVSNASSSRNHSAAAAEANTSVSPEYTTGMPKSNNASRHGMASRPLSTITAMSPAVRGRPSNCAPLASSTEMSAARSLAMYGRNAPIGIILRCGVPNSVRATTRSRNGSLCGAPVNRWRSVRASTGCTTMSWSPSAAPFSTVCSRSTRTLSLRQFSASVSRWSALRAASR